MFFYISLYLNIAFFLRKELNFGGKKMIIELSFGIVGGVNLGLEKSWKVIEYLMKRYPYAVWKKVIDWRNGKGKYIVEIE